MRWRMRGFGMHRGAPTCATSLRLRRMFSTTLIPIGPSRVALPMLSFIPCLNGSRRNTAPCRVKMSLAPMRAAEQVGRDEMARALALVEAAGARLDELVYVPLAKEMLGAIKAPAPPFQRIFNRLGDIRASEPLAAAPAASPRSGQESDTTHPPLGKRLANLGFSDIPPIDKVQNSAIDQVLSPEAVRELPARFDDEWRKNVRGVGQRW